MKITVGEILNMKDTLKKLLDKEFSPKIAFKLSKLGIRLQEELQSFENSRISLLKKYGEIDEKENTVSIEDEEKRKECAKEIEKILMEEIDIDFSPIKIDDLGDDLKLSASDITVLNKIIKQ